MQISSSKLILWPSYAFDSVSITVHPPYYVPGILQVDKTIIDYFHS